MLWQRASTNNQHNLSRRLPNQIDVCVLAALRRGVVHLDAACTMAHTTQPLQAHRETHTILAD
jgi:sulfur relay (sulfurtransferase) complex TusBCD TusD component (DsrE family)